MRLSVAICTWNRATLLNQTLARMHKLRLPEGIQWEVLVVNNNCRDNTDEVILQHSNDLPIRRVFEPSPGLSNARNAAVKCANGDYIIWTDDDVLVDDGWIEGYVRAFDRWPDVAIFGGPVTPWFEGTAPKWLKAVWHKVADAYAVRDLAPYSIRFTEEVLPYGANYAMLLSAQKQYCYDPSLGRVGNGMVGGEEIGLIRAMIRDGFSGFWIPDATVQHFIPQDRQKARYLRRYFHGQGLTLARTDENQNVARFLGYPRWMFKRLFLSEVKYQFLKIICGPEMWIEDLAEASVLWGRLQGSAASKRIG